MSTKIFTRRDAILSRAKNTLDYEQTRAAGTLASLKAELARMEAELAAGELAHLRCRLGQMVGSMESLSKSINEIDQARAAQELVRELDADTKEV